MQGQYPRGALRAVLPPHWNRNILNRKERRLVRRALHRGAGERFAYVHPSSGVVLVRGVGFAPTSAQHNRRTAHIS
jgi:hypothetical protein